MKVLFILGTGHCGSTLLDLILNNHSQITGVGEIGSKPLNHTCTCGADPQECEFWSEIIEQNKSFLSNIKIHQNKLSFLLNKKNFFYTNSKQDLNLDYYLKKNEKLYSSIMKKDNSEIIVDSTKRSHRVDCLRYSDKIEPIILHLVRDGRGVVWSYYKKYENLLSPVSLWLGKNIKIELLRKKSNLRYIFLKYSDFVNKPKATLKNILSRLELPFEENMLNFRKEGNHQIGGNRMRFGENEEIEEDLEWQKKMPYKLRFLFNFFAGWLNFYYFFKKTKKR